MPCSGERLKNVSQIMRRARRDDRQALGRNGRARDRSGALLQNAQLLKTEGIVDVSPALLCFGCQTIGEFGEAFPAPGTTVHARDVGVRMGR